MAVVRVMHMANGATVRIHDDCFRDLSREELETRRAEVEAAIWRIDRSAQMRAVLAVAPAGSGNDVTAIEGR